MALGALLPIATAAFGAGLNYVGRKKEQKRGMAMQMEANREMSELQKQNQLEVWDKTNFGAQIKHMKEAGVNPGLVYGMGGTGGATTGAGTSGTTSVPSAGDYNATGNLAQLGLMKAQKEVLESQAQKNEAEAEKIKGVDTKEAETRIMDLTQGIENKRAQETLTRAQGVMQEIQNEIGEAGKLVEIQKVIWSGEQAMNALQQAQNETYISNETYKEKVEQIRKQTALMSLEAEAKRHGIELTKEQTRAIGENIRMQDAKIDIEAFEAGVRAQDVSLWNAIGGEVKRSIHTINNYSKETGGYRTYERKDK